MQFAAFLEYLKSEKRYAENTILAYGRDLRDFSDYLLRQYELATIEQVKPIHIRSYLAEQVSLGKTNRTVNRKLSSIRSFFQFSIRQRFIDTNPASQLNALKIEKKLPVYVESITLSNAVKNSPKETFQDSRDHIMISLMYSLGLRRAELIDLRDEDIDKRNRNVTVRGKGNKVRTVPCSSKLIDEVITYQSLRNEQFHHSKFLLVTNKGMQLYPKFVYRTIKQFLSVVSTQSKKSPHVLRHSFATHLLNAGADIMSIKELLGHESLQATQVYTHTNIEELKKIYKKSHPSSD